MPRTHTAAVLDGLKQRLRELDEKRERILIAIAEIEGTPIGPVEVISAQNPEEPTRPRKGIYAGMSITDAAIHFIRSEGSPQTTSDIARALKAGGQESESKNPYRMVYNSLKHRSGTMKDVQFKDSLWVLKR